MDEKRSRETVLLYVLLGAAAVLAVVLVLVGALGDVEESVGVDLRHAGIDLGAVTVAGGFIALLTRRQELRREERREHAAYRQQLSRDVVTAYNAVKFVRRAMRGDGFRRSANTKTPRPLTALDATRLREHELALVRSQLTFEELKREEESRNGETSELFRCFKAAEVYLHAIVKEWEGLEGRLVEGASLAQIHECVHLQNLLGEGDRGLDRLSTARQEVERLLRAEAAAER